MIDWHVGQKVCCIDDNWQPWRLSLWKRFGAWAIGLLGNLPKRSQVYTIRKMHVDSRNGQLYFHLLEYPQDVSFWSYLFRPLVETKTDISVFTHLLNSSPAPVSPDLVEAS